MYSITGIPLILQFWLLGFDDLSYEYEIDVNELEIFNIHIAQKYCPFSDKKPKSHKNCQSETSKFEAQIR